MNRLKFLLRRAVSMDYRAMFRTVRSIHKQTGRSRLFLLIDMLRCAARHGAGYKDYELFEMYDLTEAQRSTYLTRGRNNAMVAKYNNKAFVEELDDKVRFNTRFQEFLHRDWVPVTGENREQVLDFLRAQPTFLAKPTHGCCGRGIERLSTADFDSPEALYDRLAQQAPGLELEEILQQHPAVSAIYPGAVNTVRMVTLLRADGTVHLLAAMFRISRCKVVDNFNSGGMVVPVDPDTGVVTACALDKEKHVYEVHPATGTPIPGFRFPDWEQAKLLVERAARLIPEVGYVGWDVCFTPDGPCLIEGNPFPGHDVYQLPAQTPDKVGVLPRFRAAEGAQS